MRIHVPNETWYNAQSDRTNQRRFNMAAPIIADPLAECIFLIRQIHKAEVGSFDETDAGHCIEGFCAKRETCYLRSQPTSETTAST